jgi:hypothetical protein
MTQATLYHKQTALDGGKPGKARRPQDGVCVAPKGVECLQSYHEGKGCKERPCRHCATSCLYWRRGE